MNERTDKIVRNVLQVIVVLVIVIVAIGVIRAVRSDNQLGNNENCVSNAQTSGEDPNAVCK